MDLGGRIFLLLILGIDLLPARSSSSYNEWLLWRLLNEFLKQLRVINVALCVHGHCGQGRKEERGICVCVCGVGGWG